MSARRPAAAARVSRYFSSCFRGSRAATSPQPFSTRRLLSLLTSRKPTKPHTTPPISSLIPLLPTDEVTPSSDFRAGDVVNAEPTWADRFDDDYTLLRPLSRFGQSEATSWSDASAVCREALASHPLSRSYTLLYCPFASS